MPVRLTFFRLLLILSGECVLYLGFYTAFLPGIVTFVLVSLVSSAIYCVFSWTICSDETDYPRSYLLAMVIAGIAFRLILVWHTPVASDDMYRYIWDGKVQSVGINPYRYEPLNPALQSLHSDLVPGKINFPGMKTLYPPFVEWFFAGAYACVGESIIGFKFALLLAELIAVVVLVFLLRTMKKPLKYLSLYLLCPLPILQFALDGHCDVLIFPFLLGMLLFRMRGKRIASYVMSGFSILAKVYPVVLVPALLLRERRKYQILAVIIPVLMLACAYLPSLLAGGSPFESLKAYSLNWAANGFLFEILYTILQNNQYAHIIITALFVIWLVYALRRKTDLPDMIFELVIGFFIFSATVHPWYITGIAVLLPAVPRKSGIVSVALVSLATIPLIPFILMGQWHQSLWLMALEYLPVFYFLWMEMFPRLRVRTSDAIYETAERLKVRRSREGSV